jgi:hypothetical protein
VVKSNQVENLANKSLIGTNVGDHSWKINDLRTDTIIEKESNFGEEMINRKNWVHIKLTEYNMSSVDYIVRFKLLASYYGYEIIYKYSDDYDSVNRGDYVNAECFFWKSKRISH